VLDKALDDMPVRDKETAKAVMNAVSHHATLFSAREARGVLLHSLGTPRLYLENRECAHATAPPKYCAIDLAGVRRGVITSYMRQQRRGSIWPGVAVSVGVSCITAALCMRIINTRHF